MYHTASHNVVIFRKKNWLYWTQDFAPWGGEGFYYNKNALKNIWDLNQVFEKVKTEVHDSLSNYQPYW